MSAFAVAIGGKADIAFCGAYVGLWPKADMSLCATHVRCWSRTDGCILSSLAQSLDAFGGQRSSTRAARGS